MTKPHRACQRRSPFWLKAKVESRAKAVSLGVNQFVGTMDTVAFLAEQRENSEVATAGTAVIR